MNDFHVSAYPFPPKKSLLLLLGLPTNCTEQEYRAAWAKKAAPLLAGNTAPNPTMAEPGENFTEFHIRALMATSSLSREEAVAKLRNEAQSPEQKKEIQDLVHGIMDTKKVDYTTAYQMARQQRPDLIKDTAPPTAGNAKIPKRYPY